MKALLITAAVIFALVLLGWVTFSNRGPTATVTIDKQEMKADTQAAAQTVKRAADKVVDETKELARDAEKAIEKR